MPQHAAHLRVLRGTPEQFTCHGAGTPRMESREDIQRAVEAEHQQIAAVGSGTLAVVGGGEHHACLLPLPAFEGCPTAGSARGCPLHRRRRRTKPAMAASGHQQ